jgi:hypothetical protein
MPRGSAPGERRGGRQAGTRNKRTVELLEKAAKLGITPLDVMLENMKLCYASGDMDGAHRAAVDAAPYLAREAAIGNGSR